MELSESFNSPALLILNKELVIDVYDMFIGMYHGFHDPNQAHTFVIPPLHSNGRLLPQHGRAIPVTDNKHAPRPAGGYTSWSYFPSLRTNSET
jgi:hypothetical protein